MSPEVFGLGGTDGTAGLDGSGWLDGSGGGFSEVCPVVTEEVFGGLEVALGTGELFEAGTVLSTAVSCGGLEEGGGA